MKTFQTILMIIGALVLSVLAFTHEEIGGYEQLVRYLDKAVEAKVLNNNKDEIIKKYKLKKNRQEIWREKNLACALD